MDLETFEQPAIPRAIIGDQVGFLKEEMEVKLTLYGAEPLDVDLPTTVDLKVTQSETAVRGDTATGVTKKVKVETGQLVDVPSFVNEGDTIRVDTRSGTYITRVM
jgi:elongation factor P